MKTNDIKTEVKKMVITHFIGDCAIAAAFEAIPKNETIATGIKYTLCFCSNK